MKIKKIIKDNILGFVIAAILFGGIGVVLATTSVTDIWFKTTKNTNVQNVKDALDDLYTHVVDFPTVCYNGVCGKLSYKYWNDDLTGDNLLDSTHIPTTAYATRELLAQNYSNFANYPMYIRSILIDGNVVGHQVCLWNNNKEYCLGTRYWAGTLSTLSENAGIQTKLKLQRDMQDVLGVTIQDSSCFSNSAFAGCSVGDFGCYVRDDGFEYCVLDVTGVGCYVYSFGSASCG